MNTAASSEKMNAWMNTTRSSRNMMNSAIGMAAKATNQPNMKIRPMSARMMTCPAIMFANNRMVSANGFVNLPMSSTGVITMVSNDFMSSGMSCGQYTIVLM